MIKKVTILIFALFMCSCSFSQPKIQEEVAPPINIKIALMQESDEIILTAIEEMNTTAQTMGNINFDYEYYDDPIKAVQNGEAHMTYVDTNALGQYANEYNSLATPFCFATADAGLAALNSETFFDYYTDYTTDRTGMKVLGATLGETDLLVSNSGLFDSVAQFEGKSVYMLEEWALAHIVSSFGGVPEFAISEALLQMINSEQEIMIQLPFDMIDSINAFDAKNQLTIAATPAVNYYNWLLIDYKLWLELNEDNQDIIKICKAQFDGVINLHKEELLAHELEHLGSLGVQIYYSELKDLTEESVDILTVWEDFRNRYNVEAFREIVLTVR